MHEPLTADEFNRFMQHNLIPHMQREGEFELKLANVHAEVQKWVKVASVGVSMLVVVGGVIAAILSFIVNEKNGEVRELQKAVIALSADQRVTLKIIDQINDELKRQSNVDSEVLQRIAELMKTQNSLLIDFAKRIR